MKLPLKYLFMRLNKLAAALAALSAAVTLSVAPAMAQSSSSSSGLGQQLSSNPEMAQQLSSAITQAVPNTTAAASTSNRKSVSVFGQGSREYILQLPAGINSGGTYPVIFSFGGAEHTAQRTKDYMRFDEVAGNDAIIVYPEGRGAFWEGPTYAQTSRGEDVDFVRSILNQLRANYNVDNSRVYAAGLSNGGGMALSLACQAPDVFSAVASVAGAYYTPVTSGCSAGNVSTLIMHGTNDNHMTWAGGIGTGGLYNSVDATFRNVGDRNDCNLNSTTTSTSGRSEIKSYKGCDRGGDTVLQKVNGGGHTWFTSDPHATRTVWNFLRSR